MKKKYKLAVFLVSLILALLLIYGMYLFQLQYIRAEQMVQIYVTNKWMRAGHIVTMTDLSSKLYPLSAMSEGYMTDAKKIVGKELIIPIGRDEPFVEWKINKLYTMPQKGEIIFQIPAGYIKSMANDVRAGDYVFLYLSHSEGQSEQLFDYPIKVSSVKTSNNVEVESLQIDEVSEMLHSNEEALYEHRRYATGLVDYINLNLSSEQWLIIDEQCKNGKAHLIIGYTPYYLDEAALHLSSSEEEIR